MIHTSEFYMMHRYHTQTRACTIYSVLYGLVIFILSFVSSTVLRIPNTPIFQNIPHERVLLDLGAILISNQLTLQKFHFVLICVCCLLIS